jgi:hypothetical protein
MEYIRWIILNGTAGLEVPWSDNYDKSFMVLLPFDPLMLEERNVG